MTAYVMSALALLGLLIGSFLNVVVHRVPRGESVVRPASRCPGCGSRIRARDNVPVVSWLLLRGRCRDCGTGISVRYPAVELLAAAVFALLGWRVGLTWQLPAFLYLGAVGVALALIDLDIKRLPNALVLPSYPVALVLLALPAVVDGRWDAYVRALAGGAVLFGGFYLLAVAKPGGMGFGDVKLSGVIGLYLGWLGWGPLAVGAFLGFLLGGAWGLALIAVGRAGRRTALPYGPFLLTGALIGVLCGAGLADAYAGLLTA